MLEKLTTKGPDHNIETDEEDVGVVAGHINFSDPAHTEYLDLHMINLFFFLFFLLFFFHAVYQPPLSTLNIQL